MKEGLWGGGDDVVLSANVIGRGSHRGSEWRECGRQRSQREGRGRWECGSQGGNERGKGECVAEGISEDWSGE